MRPETDEVFRDKIREPRDNYFVEYCPVIAGMPFATLQVVYPSEKDDNAKIRSVMEKELLHWLARFPVPIFASSFDTKGDLIHLPNSPHLMGYVDAKGQIIKLWRQMKNEELPADQIDPGYLARVYKDIPFRFAKDVREKVRRDSRFSIAVAFTIIFFTAVVPVLIEMISLGLEWLKYLLEGMSLLKGGYEIGKAFGWLKPSQCEKERSEKKSKMEHYYYHCERNPKAFQSLKLENFEAEAISKIRSEDAALRKADELQK
jgi:hypothetical protein